LTDVCYSPGKNRASPPGKEKVLENTYRQQLLSTLTLLHQEARYAYWKNRTHCGSDFNPKAHCHDCQHFPFCQTMLDIDIALAALSEMDGD